MNTKRYPRPVSDDIECTCRRCPDRLPRVEVEPTEFGEIHKFVYVEEDVSSPEFCEFSSGDMTLQAQYEAGVELHETRPIVPHTMDAVSAVMSQVVAGMNDVSSFEKPKFE